MKISLNNEAVYTDESNNEQAKFLKGIYLLKSRELFIPVGENKVRTFNKIN